MVDIVDLGRAKDSPQQSDICTIVLRFIGHTESPPGIKPALFTGIVDDIICHSLSQGNQGYMKVRINGVDVLQGVVQEIHIGDRVVHFLLA